MNFPVVCHGAPEMQSLGRALAVELAAGAVLALDGELGAGKTELVKGLAEGLGYPGAVTSPTFSLLHEYRGGRLDLFHLDFYRLKEAHEVLELGWDELLEEGGLVAVEWARLHPELLPAGTLCLQLNHRGTERVVEEGPLGTQLPLGG